LIFKLARAAQTLPYSTASVERNFSQLLDVKTIKRNRLGVENTEACLLIKQEARDECINQSSIINSNMIANYSKKVVRKVTSKHIGLDTNKDPVRIDEGKKRYLIRVIEENKVLIEDTNPIQTANVQISHDNLKISHGSENSDSRLNYTYLMIPVEESQRKPQNNPNPLKRGPPYSLIRLPTGLALPNNQDHNEINDKITQANDEIPLPIEDQRPIDFKEPQIILQESDNKDDSSIQNQTMNDHKQADKK